MNVKNFLFGLLLVPALAIGFNSCKDKDKEDKDYAAEIAGSYKGDVTGKVEFTGAEIEKVEDVIITVTRDAENHVLLAAKLTVTVGGQGIPFDINSSSKVSTDGKSSINGEAKIDLPAAALAPLVPEAFLPSLEALLGKPDANGIYKDVPVSITGSFASNKANLTISMLASQVNLNYTGTKQ
ncbi:MAG: hypothetical protein LBU62_12140 [Bacteroidales bacterium]|jgi:hypothetical protein|nr:hypothetical protein [Bacteroidales bacterium]